MWASGWLGTGAEWAKATDAGEVETEGEQGWKQRAEANVGRGSARRRWPQEEVSVGGGNKQGKWVPAGGGEYHAQARR